MPAPEITTKRLHLRPIRATDAARLRDLIDDYDIARWLASVPHPYTLEDSQAFIEMVADLDGQVWAITDADGVQGVIGVEDDLGYWLGRPAWGRGYMTEAATAVVDAWFTDPAAPDLVANYFVDNTRSAHVLGKLGFVDTGPKLLHSLAQGRDVDGRGMVLTRDRWAARAR